MIVAVTGTGRCFTYVPVYLQIVYSSYLKNIVIYLNTNTDMAI